MVCSSIRPWVTVNYAGIRGDSLPSGNEKYVPDAAIFPLVTTVGGGS